MVKNDIRQIKTIALKALFADDLLMEKLVLKGGNLLDLIFGISVRASVDLDLSIDGDFDEDVLELKRRIESALNREFKQNGYAVFDVRLKAAPPSVTPDRQDFWGGYKLEFKVTTSLNYDSNISSLEDLRRFAIPIGDGGSTKMLVDFSKYEFCRNKQQSDLDGFTIFTYAPETFVSEKIRAICQQMPIYAEKLQSHPSSRAKDFVDIYLVVNEYSIDFTTAEFSDLVKNVFEMKRVPLSLIGEIGSQREFHRAAFFSVEATMKPGIRLKKFDFYFDFVVEKCGELKALWDV